MAKRIVFYDNDNNELNCFINDSGKLYIGVGQTGEDIVYSGYITLGKSDVAELIKILTSLESEMEEEE